MNELFATYTETPGWVTWGIGASLVTVIALCFVILTRNYKTKAGLVATIAMSLASLVFGIGLMTWDFSVVAENDKRGSVAYEAREDWVQSHGVNLTKDTMSDLEFPGLSEKPTEDEDYGLAQVTTANREVTTVTLAWENSQFVLYGTDGEPLERITR